ncbi:putative sensor domain DACNV-containing protein [Mucilaginibacter sp.]|uniref:putative sensor domain DACNV-containing protein n=1 Tax=Mucilaginibacter sp. TaxID=1882438 RepID=UPI0032666F84
MRTEESDLVKITITLIDPENPDPKPPKQIVAERWICIKFEKPLEMTIKSLVKLSKASDPSNTSLAVYYDQQGKLLIWGMINQAIHYQSFLN